MKITASERVFGGGVVGQFITWVSLDGETNIAPVVSWIDPDNDSVGIFQMNSQHIKTVSGDVEWGLVRGEGG